MISRREVVTGGVLGTLSSTAALPPDTGQSASDAAALTAGFQLVQRALNDLKNSVDQGLVQPSTAAGHVGRVRQAFDTYLRTSGHFPSFCEIGTGVFYDIYDWHVKHNQQIQIIAIAENRMAIQFMFTQLILRWENEATYVGVPFDRG